MEVKWLSRFEPGLCGEFSPLPNPLRQGEGANTCAFRKSEEAIQKSVKQADRPDSVHLGLLAKTST
jgi:hypothetical protein